MVLSTWPKNPVIYEIYVRSFADADSDGVGDLRGIVSRMDHFAYLGVDAIWLTPVFESPQFDFGYDISNHLRVHPEYGTDADLRDLIQAAHERNLKVIFDIVLAHTSREHEWYSSHPDWYIWSDHVPNNWLSVFGGPAWSHDKSRDAYYYHRFYPEQPSLNWRNPAVSEAMYSVLQYWVSQGVDGFRLDSFDGLFVDAELADEPAAARTGIVGREADAWAAYWMLDHTRTTNLPEVHDTLAQLRSRFPETVFIVEADLPREDLRAYLQRAQCAFSFDLLRAPLDGTVLAGIIDGAGTDGDLAWALSNHDYPRLVSRWGKDLARVAAVLLLTLPGWSCIYQGDEIGMIDGKGGQNSFDRAGRDAMRHPMQWTPHGGFTAGVPWLPMVDPERCNVLSQKGVAGSTLEQYRRLIRLRRELSGPVRVVEFSTDHLVYARDNLVAVLNFRQDTLAIPGDAEVLYSTAGPLRGAVPAQSAVVLRTGD